MTSWSARQLRRSADMTKQKLLYFIGLGIAVAFFLCYREWFAWLVLGLMLLLPWISLLFSLRAMLTTRVKLTSPEKLEQGVTAYVKLESECASSPVPVKCGIIITKPLTGETWVKKNGASLPTSHCGTLLISTQKLYVYDRMLIFGRKLVNKPACAVRVMPKPVPMKTEKDIDSLISGAWKPKAGGGYSENHEIRAYRPGDTMNLVHWKLSEKTDSLMIREPMVPEQAKVYMKLDLCGTADELDRKFGRLLWLGNMLVERGISFTVLAMTGNGIETWSVTSPWSMENCLRELLTSPSARDGASVAEKKLHSQWQISIGGEVDEA